MMYIIVREAWRVKSDECLTLQRGPIWFELKKKNSNNNSNNNNNNSHNSHNRNHDNLQPIISAT